MTRLLRILAFLAVCAAFGLLIGRVADAQVYRSGDRTSINLHPIYMPPKPTLEAVSLSADGQTLMMEYCTYSTTNFAVCDSFRTAPYWPLGKSVGCYRDVYGIAGGRIVLLRTERQVVTPGKCEPDKTEWTVVPPEKKGWYRHE